MQIEIQKLHEDAVIPEYASELASGFDLYCLGDIEIPPKSTLVIKTGLAVSIPLGYEIQIRPRSGMSYKTKLRIANAPGTIDADYRGEIGVIVDNISNKTITLGKHFRVAQGVLCPIFKAEFIEVLNLDETKRGTGGFGSTGS